MQIEQDKSTGQQGVIVVRLLNGLLKGCEYHLAAGKTLFIAAGQDALDNQGGLSSLPEDCIVIPGEEGGGNFEIISDPGADSALLRQLDAAAPRDVVMPFNQVISVGSLSLAVRRVNETWAEDIANSKPVVLDAGEPVARRGTRQKIPLLAAAAVCLAIALLAVWWLKWQVPQREIIALTNQLSDEPDKFQVISGRDGLIYVLAKNRSDAEWGRQSLVRLKSAPMVKVVSYGEEAQRVDRWLGQHYPFLKLHQLRLDSPEKPLLRLSLQRSVLTDEDKDRLRTELMDVLPYAGRAELESLDDRAVATQAEEGLKRLAISYSRVDNADSVTFLISGSLNDGERQRVRFFVEEYQRQWGARYVRFAVELKDDWLKGKSFKYGNQGYIKMTSGHWYFNHS